MKAFYPALLASLFATSASAEVTYMCEVDDFNKGWVSPKMLISLDDSKTAAMVADGLILEVMKVPVPASVRTTPNGVVKLAWTVKDVPLDNLNTSVDAFFRASLNTKSMEIVVVVVLQGFDNDPRGQGTCKIFTKKKK